MTLSEATAAVRARFRRPLVFTLQARRWTADPHELGAWSYPRRAVLRALEAPPGTAVPLGVGVNRAKLRVYVAAVDQRLSRPARNSVLVGLRDLSPFLTKARFGRDVLAEAAYDAVLRALFRHRRAPLEIPHRRLAPRVTRESFGPIVVVRRASRRLFLYDGMRFRARFRVAVGRPAYPTPRGRFRVVVKVRNPWWYPPDAPWAENLEPVPPGPRNPLGPRWIGLSARDIGIHGTRSPQTVGLAATHGCIRMRNSKVVWLFPRVRIGTPVFVVGA